MSFHPTQLLPRLSTVHDAPQHDAGMRRSAVLVPFISNGDAWELLLTRRTELVEHHKGQVSFPGGALEIGEDAVAGALRETHEEVGIPPECVEILGILDEKKIISGFHVTPVIGILSPGYPIAPSADEVARVFTAPVDLFLDPNAAQRRMLERDGVRHEVFYYHHDGEQIWGVTARIIREVLGLG